MQCKVSMPFKSRPVGEGPKLTLTCQQLPMSRSENFKINCKSHASLITLDAFHFSKTS